MAGRRSLPRGPVNWAEIRRRVEAAGEALGERAAPAPERVRAVLEARARALARPVATPASADTLEVLTFGLARERYAIESRSVVEVFRLKDLSSLPGAEQPVFGLTAWRGELLTILDLRAALGLSVAALDDLGWVIVLGEGRPVFGMLADAVHAVVTLAASEVREPPEGVAARREYVRGVTADAVLVLDAKKLLRIQV
jgi:purine-binding chemotaxis protein CheW